MANSIGATSGVSRRVRNWLLAAVAVVALGVVLNHYVEKDPTNLAFQAFIRSQAQVTSQVGTVSSVELLKSVTLSPGYGGVHGDTPGYTQYLYRVVGERGQATVEVRREDSDHPIEITQVHLSKAPFNTALTYMGLLVLTGGIAGMIWGDRVIARHREGVWRFFELRPGWSRYLKWPLGLGLVLIGFITMLMGVNGWGN
ncbi:hypothetical protein [Pseudomonas yamanorum]|uniref:Uncharacterized protein n=1 Tax=Pseudomonas yamanorum TaxID=515393 RepID=A0A7Y8EF36_9PSED|nr:hypothetical protein [Pseudomonas yamanorum]NWE13528.1 hypothetical protein [Pseudomonas yamanorum]